MPVFVIIIVLSFVFYLFYKVRYFRSKRPVERKWISAKSSIALGLFVAVFGLNQLFIHLSPVSITVSIVFILLGIINIWGGVKSYKYYLPLAIEEANQWQKENASL